MKLENEIIFVAEIGLNHNGNKGLFFELIKKASEAGANIAKFQLGWKSNPGEINELTDDDINQIYKCCNYFKIEPMFSIFNSNALKQLDKYHVEKYKIASRTLVDDISLVKKIIEKKKLTIISLGMWEKNDLPFTDLPNVKYLWCKSKYPVYPWDLKEFPKKFDGSLYYGYSDHTVGIEIPLIAISRGAKIIEKHFTLDKSDTTIRDHALSASPEEFKLMVQIGKNIKKNLDLGI